MCLSTFILMFVFLCVFVHVCFSIDIIMSEIKRWMDGWITNRVVMDTIYYLGSVEIRLFVASGAIYLQTH